MDQPRTIVYTGSERRSGNDRRRRKRSLFQQLTGKGMRETSRRAEDRKQIVIFDRYPPSLLVGTILVLALSMLDAALTLILLSEGARELNPVMLYYLGHGPAAFLMVKYVLTVLSLLIIIIGNEVLVHRYRVCSKLLPLFAILFGSVVIWEFYLLSIVP